MIISDTLISHWKFKSCLLACSPQKTISLFPNICFLFMMLFTFNVQSQEIFNTEILEAGIYEGYVITLDRDTLTGKILIGTRDTKTHGAVTFIDDLNEKTVYYPSDLLAFHTGNTHFIGNVLVYVDGIPQFRKVFLQQLIDGYIKYYRLLNYQLGNAGPSAVPKTMEYYYISKGKLRPNRVYYFKDLCIYTRDHSPTDGKIYGGFYRKEDIPDILNAYNIAMVQSGKLDEKLKRDSIYSTTTLSLNEAEKNSLLYYQDTDPDMHEYFFRILYYAYNTPGYKGYIIYDKRDRVNREIELGLKINHSHGFKQVGTWRYYDGNNKTRALPLVKEEHYDLDGKLHGQVVNYDENGNIKKSFRYEHGEKQP